MKLSKVYKKIVFQLSQWRVQLNKVYKKIVFQLSQWPVKLKKVFKKDCVSTLTVAILSCPLTGAIRVPLRAETFACCVPNLGRLASHYPTWTCHLHNTSILT